MIEFVLSLGPKGLFLFSIISSSAGYFLSLALTKSSLSAMSGAFIRALVIIALFWDARVIVSNISDIALNLSVIMSIVIFCFGTLIGLVASVKIDNNLTTG